MQYHKDESVLKIILIICTLPIFVFCKDIVSNVLFDDASVKLEQAMKDMMDRQHAAAYNIANASTPGFKPIRYPDEVQEAMRLYGNDKMLEAVNIDDEMVKSTRIRLKHSAYVRLLSTKIGITKKVVTLGKGG